MRFNKFVIIIFILLLLWIVDAFVTQAWTHLKKYTFLDPAIIISLLVFILSLFSIRVANKEKRSEYDLSVVTLFLSFLMLLFASISYYYQVKYFQEFIG